MTEQKPRPRQLGRGLSALLGEAAVYLPNTEGSPRGAASAPVERIAPSPLQPRRSFAEDEIASLAESIRERGVLQPILVRPYAGRPGHYEIVAGERRWRAAQLAQLHEVPIIVRELADDGVLEIALVENIQRADLNAVEEAEAYRRLTVDFGLSQEAVARRVGKDRSTVSNALRLLRLPRKVLDDVVEGRLSEGHARALLAVEGEADQLRLRDLIANGGLSVRAAEALVRRYTPAAPRPRRRAVRDHDLGALEARLRESLGTKVRILRKGKGGTVEIEFYAEEDLERILAALGAGR